MDVSRLQVRNDIALVRARALRCPLWPSIMSLRFATRCECALPASVSAGVFQEALGRNK
jgi:hypothetical protein